MYKSNQFPRQCDKDRSILPTNQKAHFILSNMKNKMPNLYKQIMNNGTNK
jgi:hypothetical protein